MIVNIKLSRKNEHIRKHILEQAIITYISHVIVEFNLPVEINNFDNSFSIEVRDEKSLRFYIESIINYCSYELVEFINMLLNLGDIEYAVINNEGEILEKSVDAIDLNKYFGKDWFHN